MAANFSEGEIEHMEMLLPIVMLRSRSIDVFGFTPAVKTMAGQRYYFICFGILKSFGPAATFSGAASGGGSRCLPLSGKNPDLCHLLLFRCVIRRPLRPISPR